MFSGIGMHSQPSRTSFDPATVESSLDAVFRAVTDHKNVDIARLPPLEPYLDGDAILHLFGESGSSTLGIAQGSLRFRYDDVFVTLTHDGWVEVTDVDAASPDSVLGDAAPAPGSSPADRGSDRPPERALREAATAVSAAEAELWNAADATADDAFADRLSALVERLWSIQSDLDALESDEATR